jgi:uncharacterized iron-regulated protein
MKPSTVLKCVAVCILAVLTTAAHGAPAKRLQPTAVALERAMLGHGVILLGETHDNGVQQRLRLDALRQLVATGARPVMAFEQFDRQHQADIDDARRERPGDATYLIGRAQGDPGWNWDYYRPLVELALQYDLPIVAANLSRDDAMRVATSGWSALFDAKTRDELKLDRVPADIERKQLSAVRAGHCNLLPAEQLQPLAQAQIARDIVMARSIRPYLDRDVVLLAGNGHVRRDIGVPRWLPPDGLAKAISIGLFEREQGIPSPRSAQEFDAYLVTAPAERSDPCAELTRRFRHR